MWNGNIEWGWKSECILQAGTTQGMAPAEIINIGKYIFGHEDHYTILVGLDIFYLELTENN